MRMLFSVQQIAQAVWNMVAVANRTVGAAASVTGAVGSVTGNVGGNVAGSVGSVTGNVGGNVAGSVGSVTTVSDKTGYSLTAGSYSPIKSIQRGTIAITDSGSSTTSTGTATITAVTVAKASIHIIGSIPHAVNSTLELTNTTTVTGTIGRETATLYFEVVEYF